MQDSVFGIPIWQIEAARKPFLEAGTLPPGCYTSAEWHAQEVAKVFRREWVCVGRAEQVPDAGDYFTMTLCNEPVIVVRDREAGVRAFSNVCRHRGCVVATGSGNSMTLQCPYHRWTYALTGELLATPGRPHPMNDVAGFRQEDYGLLPLRTAEWGGFVFVNIGGEAAPLATWLGDLPGWTLGYDFAAMTTVRRVSHTVASNWKVFLENSFEPYHIPFLHQRQIDLARPPAWEMGPAGNGPYMSLYSRDSLLGTRVFPVIDGLTPSYMSYRQYLPLGPDKFELACGWCFPRSTQELPGFAEAAAKVFEKSDAVMREDIEVCPQIQAGLGSSLYRPGRYAVQEAILHGMGLYVLDRVLGG
jgi:choline monooxygenase